MERQKTKERNIKRVEAEVAFQTYNQLACRLEELENQKNQEIEILKKQYETKSKTLVVKKNEAFDKIHAFAIQHPRLFEKKKTVQLNCGSLGFRKGMPKIKIADGLEMADVLLLIKKQNAAYVRTVEELNKDLLIADRNIIKNNLKDCGIEILQEETFFIRSGKVNKLYHKVTV